MAEWYKTVVLGVHSAPTYAVFNFLKAKSPYCSLVLEEPEGRWRMLRRRARKLGFTRVLGQVVFQLLVASALRKLGSKRIRQIQEEFGLSIRPSMSSYNVQSVNSSDCIEFLLKNEPNLIVLAGTRLLSKRFLESMPCPVVNIHAGITPLYRGVHGAYWALAEGKPSLCGVTVHIVDAGIDTGAVLEQAIIAPNPQDNFSTYPWIQLGVGLTALASLIPYVVRGNYSTKPPLTEESQLRTHPTVWQYLRYWIDRGVK